MGDCDHVGPYELLVHYKPPTKEDRQTDVTLGTCRVTQYLPHRLNKGHIHHKVHTNVDHSDNGYNAPH